MVALANQWNYTFGDNHRVSFLPRNHPFPFRQQPLQWTVSYGRAHSEWWVLAWNYYAGIFSWAIPSSFSFLFSFLLSSVPHFSSAKYSICFIPFLSIAGFANWCFLSIYESWKISSFQLSFTNYILLLYLPHLLLVWQMLGSDLLCHIKYICTFCMNERLVF